jgi:cytochrome c
MKSLRLVLIASFAAASIGLAGAANADEALAKNSGCLKCHAIDKKKMGSSFKEVAAKYKGKADATATLVATLKAGKEHPAVKASDEDLEKLSKWILSL